MLVARPVWLGLAIGEAWLVHRTSHPQGADTTGFDGLALQRADGRSRPLAAPAGFALRAQATRRLRRGRIFFALEGGGLGRLVPFAGDGALAGAAGKEDGGENAPR